MRCFLQPKVIQDGTESSFVLYSNVREPLADLSFLQRALALAELAMIAYNDQAEAQAAARVMGFAEADLYDHDGSQAYVFENAHDLVLACRGTEPTEWNDLEADANAALSMVGALGRVHSGFNQEVNDLWPQLKFVLRENRKPVWFCGHSLGAAMATILAYRCTTSAIVSDPRELHTFGSPRVGCKRFVRHAEITHFRWVNNNDVVTRVPPTWLGYRHGGKEIYLDSQGSIRRLSRFNRSKDRLFGLLAGLLGWRFDWLADHSIGLYARHIARAASGDLTPYAKRLSLRYDRMHSQVRGEQGVKAPSLLPARRRNPTEPYSRNRAA